MILASGFHVAQKDKLYAKSNMTFGNYLHGVFYLRRLIIKLDILVSHGSAETTYTLRTSHIFTEYKRKEHFEWQQRNGQNSQHMPGYSEIYQF